MAADSGADAPGAPGPRADLFGLAYLARFTEGGVKVVLERR